jgi:glycosyltransferase involved in cell wall biosynthesis
LRVCYLTGSFNGDPTSGRLYGPDRLMFELAKRVKRANPLWDITIIALSKESKNEEYFEGIRVIRKSIFEPLPQRLFWIIENLLRIKPEVIHTIGSYRMGIITLLIRFTSNGKKFITINEFHDNQYSKLAFLFSNLDGIIVQTTYAKALLSQKGVNSAKIKIIRYGAEDDFQNGKLCSAVRSLGKKIILFYGDARRDRGFSELVAAIPQVLSRSDVVFLLCIRDVYSEYINIMEQLRLNNRVIVWMTNDYPCSISDILRSVDLVVLPFKRNTCEPPLSIVETKAAGRVLVTTNVGGIKEAIDLSTDKMIEVDDLSSLAEMIVATLNSSTSDGHIHIFGSWEITVSKIMQAYETGI